MAVNSHVQKQQKDTQLAAGGDNARPKHPIASSVAHCGQPSRRPGQFDQIERTPDTITSTPPQTITSANDNGRENAPCIRRAKNQQARAENKAATK
jgi:hypothetical protein